MAGKNNTLRDNLVALLVFPASYQKRFEAAAIEWMASIETYKASGTTLVGNVVAGSERAAYSLNGDPCTDGSVTMANNTAHSTVVALQKWQADATQVEKCSRFSGFYVYKSFSYGFYSNSPCSIVIENSKFVDNGMSIFTYIMFPDAKEHAFKRKFLKVTDSLFVGASGSYNCTTDIMQSKDHPHIRLAGQAMSWAFKDNVGRVAIGWPTFACGTNLAPTMRFNNNMDPPALYGNIIIQGNLFFLHSLLLIFFLCRHNNVVSDLN